MHLAIFSRRFALLIPTILLCSSAALAAKLETGQVIVVKFTKNELPPSLYNLATDSPAPPTLKFRLPNNYDSKKPLPLLLYLPGNHGSSSGNIGNAQSIIGPQDWVVASVPLFKQSIDQDEIYGGIVVGFEDADTLSQAYRTMLGKLFELVPNIDPEQSAIVGFSNGALALAVLISSHDEFILTHFKHFVLVDQGMFHLNGLQKKYARDSRFLILSGDNQIDLGRDLKIRGGQLLEDSWRLLGIDLSFHIMKNTGHEFRQRQMAIVGRWLRQEAFASGEILTAH